MFPAIEKTAINPILRSKLLELDLNCPVHQNSAVSKSPTLCLKMTDRTAIVFELDNNCDAVELNNRIKAIVDTAHCSPKRAELIADALSSFLQVRGLDTNFKTILATSVLGTETKFSFDSKGEKTTLPSMPIAIDSGTEISTKQLALVNMPSSEKSRSEYIELRTIDLGGPKNLNFRRKRSWRFFDQKK